ncbi:hypothetical protein [Phenylobacterium sp.]|jgi:hypothetical protein|uniref:hypothetical protein n=1 Tax=Phenylobacterium sp. TaxID=1871053 RepID=UPI002E32865C|nr:hypothetical protein [Phenylobacterium sp.]HEX3364050.1 hypothetical protein [Phenylobacterium sp.]
MKTLSPYTVAAALAAAAIFGGQALAQTPALGLQPTPPTNTPLTAPPSAAPLPSAQAPAPTQPSAAPPASSATAPSGTDTSARAAGGASLMTGMSVKDNTGALIGEVSGLKGGIATIKMGADTFTVDGDKLGVANGVATINASQAELKKMLPKK